jgi:hypothetical protein
MDREAARQEALTQVNETLKREKIEPEEFLPRFCIRQDAAGNTIDERLELRELSGHEAVQFEEDAKRSLRIAMGNLLVKAILLPGTETHSGDALFNEKDREAILGYGTSKLIPLRDRVLKMSGLTSPEADTTPKDTAKNA